MPRLVIAIASLISASIAHADPAAADRAVAEAETRAQAKDFVGAAAKYREAYAADPRPELICNVGVAYYKAQDLPRAQLYLSRCLERGSSLDAKFIEVVRAKLSTLEDALRHGSFTPVDIVVEPRFATIAIGSFAGDETFDGGRTVWLPFGTDHITVRADGYAEQTVEVHAADHAILPEHVTLEKQPESRPPPKVESHAVVVVPHAVPPSPSIVPPIVTTVVAAGLAGVAVVSAVQARDHADRAAFALSDGAYQNEADAVSKWNTIFGVDVALAGLAAVASGYLWYRVAHAGIAVEATPGGGAVSFGGRF